MPPAAGLLSVVTTSIGVYGSAPTCHLSALARCPDYSIEALDDAIETDRSLVRARTMRNSVYTLTRDLLALAVPATRHAALRGYASFRRSLGSDYERLARAAEAALENGPLAAVEIRARVDPTRQLGPGFNLFLGLLAAECRIVRANISGGWRSNRLSYARWHDWIPGVDPHGIGPDEARGRLAQRYVAAYGPVEFEDVRWWAGWSAAEARSAVDGVDLTVSGDAMTQLLGVRLLPVWDVLMVAYRNRDRLLDPDQTRFVYDRFGNATSVVLDAGRVVGVWDLGRSDDPLSISVAPFGSWPSQRWEGLAEQAHRIAAMIGTSTVNVNPAFEPYDLMKAPRNRFLAPLSGR